MLIKKSDLEAQLVLYSVLLIRTLLYVFVIFWQHVRYQHSHFYSFYCQCISVGATCFKNSQMRYFLNAADHPIKYNFTPDVNIFCRKKVILNEIAILKFKINERSRNNRSDYFIKNTCTSRKENLRRKPINCYSVLQFWMLELILLKLNCLWQLMWLF